jgi:hypothetical protein
LIRLRSSPKGMLPMMKQAKRYMSCCCMTGDYFSNISMHFFGHF